MNNSFLKTRFGLATFCKLSLVMLTVLAASIQNPENLSGQEKFIRVIGVGTATAKVETIEITTRLEAHGDTSEEALEKFGDAKKVLSEAINPMDLPGVSLVFDSPKMTPGQQSDGPVMMMGPGMVEEEEPADLGFDMAQSAKICVKVSKLDSSAEKLELITKAIDLAGTNKAVFGTPVSMFHYNGESPSSLLIPKVADKKAMIIEAEKKAIEDGTEKAKRLAGLVGASIGGIISITAKDEESDLHVQWAEYNQKPESFDEVTVERRFTLVFELK